MKTKNMTRKQLRKRIKQLEAQVAQKNFIDEQMELERFEVATDADAFIDKIQAMITCCAMEDWVDKGNWATHLHFYGAQRNFIEFTDLYYGDEEF